MAKVKVKGLVSCAGAFMKDGSIGKLSSIAINKTYEVDNTKFDVDKLIAGGIVQEIIPGMDLEDTAKPIAPPEPPPEPSEPQPQEVKAKKTRAKRTKKVEE